MRFTACFLMIAGFIGGAGDNARAGNTTSPKPEWQIKLTIPDYPDGVGLRPSVRPAVTFVDSNKLAVAYAIPAPKGSRSAWELDLLVLSAADGSIQGRNTFSMAGRNAGLFRSLEGKLVVSLGDGLRVLSQTLSTERSRALEGGIEPYSDGNHVILVKSQAVAVKTGPQSGYVRGAGYNVSFVRLDTLETQAACERAGLDIPAAILGDWVATSVSSRDAHRGIYLGSFCEDWKRISDLQGRPDFLGPETLVVTDLPDTDHPHLTVITTTGKEVCTTELKKHSGSLEPVKPSLRGTRFAVRIHDLAGLEIPSLDIYRHVSKVHIGVYGFMNGACTPSLLEVETRGSPRPPSDFALSPDGGRLVIIGDGQVRMFRVP